MLSFAASAAAAGGFSSEHPFDGAGAANVGNAEPSRVQMRRFISHPL
jgi:hypothetical protein